MKKTNIDFDQAAEALGLYANGTRLRILSALLSGESSVTNLSGECTVSLSGISQHLSKLKAGGLVRARREAQSIYYSLQNKSAVESVLELAGGL